jgi:hypothetical protein
MVYDCGVTHVKVIQIIKLQKNTIRIMLGCTKMVSYKPILRKLKILLFVSQYILPVMLFVIKNKNQIIGNSEILSVDTLCTIYYVF